MPLKVSVIGGGSSMFVPDLIRRFIEAPCFESGTVSLMDVDRRRLDVMDSLARILVENEGARLRVESTLDQRESLTNADFVIVAISVGGMAAWESDIEIPARHGVFMHIHDSIGPGGIFRAFRNAPVLASVSRDLAEVSPGAWVLNYTNPATAMVIAMQTVPEVRSASLCSCSAMPRSAAWLAELAGVQPAEIAAPALVAGLNHCTAITDVRLADGSDALPLIRQRSTEPVVNWAIDTFGLIPYCWMHWVEFFPQLQRLEEPYAGRAQGLRMKYGRRIYDMDDQRARALEWQELAERWNSPEHRAEARLASLPVGPEHHGVEVVDVIESIVENRNELFIVNAANDGAVGNLPDDAIVEVPAVVGRYGIRPVRVGVLPESFASHLRRHWSVQELTAEAALTGDRRIALQAFLLDPLLEATLDIDEIEQLLDEMLEANEAFLPQFA